jgi:hypothetical protein
MNTAARTCASLLTLSVSLVSISCAPQRESEAESESKANTKTLQLAVQILAEPSAYRMKDSVHLDTRLKNIGAEPFYIFNDMCWNMANHLTLEVLDESGNYVKSHSDAKDDCLPAPPPKNDTSGLIKMEPGSFEAITDNFDVRELVPGPGEYDLVVHYHSGISQEWISQYGGPKMAALPIWTSDYSEIASNRLHIIVKP